MELSKETVEARRVLESAIWSTFLTGHNPKLKGPGKIVEQMRPEQREKLKKLKSEDIANLRVENYIVESEDTTKRKEFSKMKLKFEKEVLQI